MGCAREDMRREEQHPIVHLFPYQTLWDLLVYELPASIMHFLLCVHFVSLRNRKQSTIIMGEGV